MRNPEETIGKLIDKATVTIISYCDDEGNGSLKRLKKDSFYWYQKVISSQGEDL